jgi:cytochrome c oxidase subunit II
MTLAKRLIFAFAALAAPGALAGTALAAAPAAAPAAVTATAATSAVAPAAPATTDEAAAPAATATATAAAPASAIFAAPGYVRTQPTPGVGQPVQGGIDFQPQATANGRYAHWLNNVVLLPLMAMICLFVLGLMLWIVGRYRKKANPVPSKTTHNTFIEVVWTAVPVLILAAIAVPSIDLLARQYAPPPADAITVKVTGYQWYWGYEYPDHGIGEFVSNMLTREQAAAMGEPFQLAPDNRLVVPVNETIKLIVTGSDVIHSFAVPALWTKMDAVPGRLNEVTFRATQEGVYYGQCSELCGVNHAFMPIAVEVVSAERFAAYVAARGGQMPSAAATAAAAATATATPNAPTAGATNNTARPGVAAEVPGAAPAAAPAPVTPVPAAAAPAAAPR